MANVPKNVVKAAKANPAAAKNFNKYFHEVEPKIMAAQKKFAAEMNKQVQTALKNYFKGEKVKLPEEEIKKMEAESAKICEKLCKAGDKVVKAEFKKMSAGVVAAMGAKKAK